MILNSIVHGLQCLPLALLVWLPLALLTSLVFLTRQVVNLIFIYYYDSKFTLMAPTDTIFNIEDPPRLCQVSVAAGLLRGVQFRQKDLERLRARTGALLEKPVNRKLMYCPVNKLGFFCWEDVSSSFKLENHVNFCEEAGSKVLTKAEFLNLLPQLCSKPFPRLMPKWELLVIPVKYYPSQGPQGICTAMVIRFCHTIMDGLCVLRLFQSIASENEDTLMDITMGSEDPPQRWQTFVDACETFMYAPKHWAKILAKPPKTRFFEGDSRTTENFYGRSKIEMSLPILAKIRKSFGSTTESIFLTALNGALLRLGRKKGMELPETLQVVGPKALFPYPNLEPQNRTALTVHRLATLPNSSNSERLGATCDALKKEPQNGAKYSFLIQRILGMMPHRILYGILRLLDEGPYEAFVVNIVPAGIELRLEGQLVSDFVVIIPPGLYRTQVTVINCNGKYSIEFFSRRSALIDSVSDLNEVIAGFELEIQSLASVSN